MGISFTTNVIAVQNKRSVDEVKLFAGYDDPEDLYKAFESSFSEETNYKDTVEFFKPNQSIKLS